MCVYSVQCTVYIVHMATGNQICEIGDILVDTMLNAKIAHLHNL